MYYSRNDRRVAEEAASPYMAASGRKIELGWGDGATKLVREESIEHAREIGSRQTPREVRKYPGQASLTHPRKEGIAHRGRDSARNEREKGAYKTAYPEAISRHEVGTIES